MAPKSKGKNVVRRKRCSGSSRSNLSSRMGPEDWMERGKGCENSDVYTRPNMWNVEQKSESYTGCIHALLKSLDPEFEISAGALGTMNSLIIDHLEKLASEAGRLAQYNGRTTIASGDIQAAVRLTFPGDLGHHAVSMGKKALAEYMQDE